ncbi:MAG: hypothetical protein MI810_07160 [Flavobacteriales bacterium]|nr:hypothetical protein [Flavobacteriales bacterium]
MKSFISSFGAIFAALAASTCCVAPLLSLAGFLGVSASQIAWLATVKPYLISASLGIIGFNLYRAYFPKKEQECCDLDSNNELSKKESKIVAKLRSKTFLWIVAGVTMTILILPYFQ